MTSVYKSSCVIGDVSLSVSTALLRPFIIYGVQKFKEQQTSVSCPDNVSSVVFSDWEELSFLATFLENGHKCASLEITPNGYDSIFLVTISCDRDASGSVTIRRQERKYVESIVVPAHVVSILIDECKNVWEETKRFLSENNKILSTEGENITNIPSASLS